MHRAGRHGATYCRTDNRNRNRHVATCSPRSLALRPGTNLALDARVSQARPIIASKTTLITRRTAQRQLLLRPCQVTTQSLLYCLGLAQLRYPVEIHGYCFLSNHPLCAAAHNQCYP